MEYIDFVDESFQKCNYFKENIYASSNCQPDIVAILIYEKILCSIICCVKIVVQSMFSVLKTLLFNEFSNQLVLIYSLCSYISLLLMWSVKDT